MDKAVKKISEHEQKTYSLFVNYLFENWSSNAQMVANVFNAFSGNAYSCDHLERIVCALFSYKEISLQKTLAKLVKAKVLRSRMHCGQRVYEVNY